MSVLASDCYRVSVHCAKARYVEARTSFPATLSFPFGMKSCFSHYAFIKMLIELAVLLNNNLRKTYRLYSVQKCVYKDMISLGI